MLLRLDDESHQLRRSQARRLRNELTDALTARRAFLRTVGEHRADGRYVVSRRHADSAGHRKVFERFAALERLYERLPERFTADDVGRTGLTGGRRHMFVRHVVEHPAFGCELVSRQPLTVEKRGGDAADGSEQRDRNDTEGNGVVS